MTREEKAVSLFNQGYNCCQAVVGAFADAMGLEEEAALKLASTFGGGMGQMRLTCGTVTGMFMILGAVKGYDVMDDPEKKRALNTKVQELAAQFQDQFGAISCKELLHRIGAGELPAQVEGCKRPCGQFVRYAVKMIEEEINNEENCSNQ